MLKIIVGPCSEQPQAPFFAKKSLFGHFLTKKHKILSKINKFLSNFVKILTNFQISNFLKPAHAPERRFPPTINNQIGSDNVGADSLLFFIFHFSFVYPFGFQVLTKLYAI